MVLGLAAAALAGTMAIETDRGAVPLYVPDSADGPVPLIVNLHGYGSDGLEAETYMQFLRLAEEQGFAYTAPTGREDWFGANYWNATDYCCDFFGDTDDVGYLNRIVDAIEADVAIDPDRVFLVGHSNGGFMSYRLACETSERFAALVSLAGATFDDPRDCAPSEPVSVLQVHGTRDGTIAYTGDCGFTCYPGAVETVQTWARYNACDETVTEGGPRDLSFTRDGDDTRTFAVNGCAPGGDVELWMIPGGGHIPALGPGWAEGVVDWLYAHPKP